MIFYFSGAGNSAWVARRLAAALGEQLVPIAEYSDETFDLKPDESVGLVFPVYSWAPPAVVMDFIRRVKLGSPSYLYFVCTCGDDAGKTANVFAKAVKARGWMCNAGFSVIMPNTYVALPGFDTDGPELEHSKVEAAKGRIQDIAGQLMMRVEKYDCAIGPAANFKTYVISPLFNRYQIDPKPFHATDACLKCGKCERICPVHNIKVDEAGPHWGPRCTQCLACFHGCPENAVHYGKATEGKRQYKGEWLV